MNKYIILFYLFILSNLSIAQQANLSGIVKDSLSQKPIPYASIALYGSDNKIVDGAITNSTGDFKFTKLKNGKYNLTIKVLGYNQLIKPIYFDNKLSLDLGEIFLSDNTNLIEEVGITAKQELQKHSIDKQSYQASQYKNAQGGTGLDLVKNLPSASIDPQGNINIRGNTGIMVLINGKPSILDPTTILSQIAANDIQEIEYITSPSAQFDPDGKGGIINIKTKKSISNGLLWQANLQGGLPSTGDYNNLEKQKRYGGDIAFQYRANKLDLSGSVNYLRNDNAGFRDGEAYTIIGDKQTFFPSQGERSFDKYNYGARLNGDYKISNKSEVSLAILASRKYQDRRADIYYKNKTIRPSNGQVISSTDYFNPNLQNKQGEFYLANFNYKYKLNTKHTLDLGTTYEYAHIYGSTKNSNIEKLTDTIQRTLNTYKNPLHGLRISLQHQWALDNGQLMSGYQFRQDRQKGNFEYFATENTLNDLVFLPEFSGKMNASNTVHALFSQYDHKTNRTQISLGLRYEYYKRDLLLIQENKAYPYSIHQLYPNLSLMHDLGNNYSWKIAAARRVQRTNNFELNPIPEREHSETLEQGDPELLPEFITNAETGFVKKIKSGSIFVNGYYQHTKNPIQRVNSVYADTILNRVFTNADYASRYGIEFGGEGRPLQWLKLNGGFNLYNYTVSGKVLNDKDTRKSKDWVYSFNAGIQADFLKTWSTGLQINYLSARPTVQGKDSRFVTPYYNLSKSIWKGALTAQLQWQFIELGKWGVNEQRITTSSHDFYTTTNYIYEKNVIMLNLNFNIHKLNQLFKLPKSEFGEKEF